MWFHDELVPVVDPARPGLALARVDGLRAAVGGGHKAPHLRRRTWGRSGSRRDCVLIGDSVDDADAAEEVGAGGRPVHRRLHRPGGLRATGRPVATTLVEAGRRSAVGAVSP